MTTYFDIASSVDVARLRHGSSISDVVINEWLCFRPGGSTLAKTPVRYRDCRCSTVIASDYLSASSYCRLQTVGDHKASCHTENAGSEMARLWQVLHSGSYLAKPVREEGNCRFHEHCKCWWYDRLTVTLLSVVNLIFLCCYDQTMAIADVVKVVSVISTK